MMRNDGKVVNLEERLTRLVNESLKYRSYDFYS